jgi:hypothetical protein
MWHPQQPVGHKHAVLKTAPYKISTTVHRPLNVRFQTVRSHSASLAEVYSTMWGTQQVTS